MTLTASFDGIATAPHSWRAPGPALLAHVDLSGLVETGLVTGVQVQADGGLLIECPNGLPADLAGMVEPLDDAVEDRLSRLERGLARLSTELAEKERLTDRLDAVEFGLTEKLQGVIAEELVNLVAEQEDDGPTVTDRIDAILAAVRQPGGGDPEILTRIEELCARPAPQIELAPMRQMNSRFLQAMAQVMTRLESSIEALQKPASQGFDDLAEQVAALASRVETLRPVGDLTDVVAILADRIAAMEARPAAVPDLSAHQQGLETALGRIEAATDRLSDQGTGHLVQEMQALRDGLAGLHPAPVLAALQDLTARVAALEARPAPLPDLTEQRKSLAGFATAFGASLRRIEALADRFDTARNDQVADAMAALRAQLADIGPGLAGKLEEVMAAQQALPALEAKLEALAAAQGSPAEVREKLDAILSAQKVGHPDPLAEAILALAGRVAAPPSALPGIEAFRAAQQDFFQDLRFLLAEIVATQMRAQAAG